jgi:putative molybdopterin biosynthesis protein
VYNLPHARRALTATGGLVVAFAAWEQGLVVGPGNPKGIHKIEDLARPDVRLVNRESGAGSRALLDELRQRAGVSEHAILGYDRVVRSHHAVAMTVASGGADVGVALRATARSLGLGFVPLVEARFDLVIPTDHLEHPAVVALLDLLQTRALRADVRALAGYDADQMGTILETVAPGA